MTISRRSCSKSTSMSGGSRRSSDTKRSNRRSLRAGIDRGDPEHIADRRVGRRSPALAEDVLRAGEADDGVHRQEVGRVVELLDQGELVPQAGADLVGQALGVARRRPLPGQLLQRLLWAQRRIVAFLGVLVGEFVEREAAAVGDLEGARERLGIAAEEPVHLLRRLEEAIGMALAPFAERVDRHVVPDAGDHILQHAAVRLVEEHVVGDDRRDARSSSRAPPARGGGAGRSAAGAA